jgi:phosphoribosylamine--glycine ligase
VILAAGGYPGPYEKGHPIAGLDMLPPEILVFHAGTKREDDGFLTAAGRVLGVTALGKDIKEARDIVYRQLGSVSFKDMHYRKDIAMRALKP